MSTPSPPRWLFPAALLALLLVAALPLLLAAGTEPLLAWSGAEVWGHAWTWWWHGQALPAWPAGTDLATGTGTWPVIDPLPALLGATISRLAGPVLAWNSVALLAIAGAFGGGWWLARRLGGSGLVGGLVLAMGPIFTGSLLSGLSEDLAVGLLAVVVGLVMRPGADRWRWALATGACLGLLAWCGPYLAWLGATTATLAGLIHIARSPRTWTRWVSAAALAAAIALPPLLAQGDRVLSGLGHRGGIPMAGDNPFWLLNPWGQADLATLLLPGLSAVPAAAAIRLHPAYLGVAVLGLALLAGRSRWWWVLLAGVLLAMGEQLHWLGQPTGLPNPLALAIDLLPGGAMLKHHARLLLLGQVALSALAALGAARLAQRWRPRPALVMAALLVLLDYGLLAPIGWPLPRAEARAPDLMAQLGELEPGPLLLLPAGAPDRSPQRPLLDQRVHGRPLLLDPNRPGAPTWLPRSPAGRWLLARCNDEAPSPPPSPDLAPLREHAAVLVVEARCAHHAAELLGPPDHQGQDGSAWDLGAVARRLGAPGSAPVPTPAARGDMLMLESTP
jgi:hypothetical protein